MRRLAVIAIALLLAGCASPAVTPASAPCQSLTLTLEQRTHGDLDSYDLVATNRSDATCSLTGNPTVEVLAVDGSVLAAAPEPSDAATPVELAPGDAAYALIEFERGEVLCDSSDTGGLRVTMPGETESTVLDEEPVLFCSGDDQVRAGAFRAEPLEGHELRPDDEDPDY